MQSHRQPLKQKGGFSVFLREMLLYNITIIIIIIIIIIIDITIRAVEIND